MNGFRAWLIEADQATKERLEAAVGEYMANDPPPEQCYYVPYFDVNIDSPEDMERLVGPGYDRKTKAVRGDHPTAFKCIGVAHGLADFLKEKGFRARVVAGWYGRVGKGYPPEEIRLDSPSPPGGAFSRTNSRQHWWVEADGFYVDLTSAQFHPLSPQDQRRAVVRDKSTAFGDGEYALSRRLPLGRRAKLPPGVVKMIDKIASMKKFMYGRSGNYKDRGDLSEWIKKNASKYGLEETRLDDLFMSMRGQDFHFADRFALARLFGEVFDDLEEDQSPAPPDEFVPPRKRGSRGKIWVRSGRLELKSTNGDDIEGNFERMREVILSLFPDAGLDDPSYDSYRSYGSSKMHTVMASMREPKRILSSEAQNKLNREGFAVEIYA